MGFPLTVTSMFGLCVVFFANLLNMSVSVLYVMTNVVFDVAQFSCFGTQSSTLIPMRGTQ
jgi:hypothetical protein